MLSSLKRFVAVRHDRCYAWHTHKKTSHSNAEHDETFQRALGYSFNNINSGAGKSKYTRKKRWTLGYIVRSRAFYRCRIFGLFLEIWQSNTPVTPLTRNFKRFSLILRPSFLWVIPLANKQLYGSYSAGCRGNIREHTISCSSTSKHGNNIKKGRSVSNPRY